MSDSSAKASHAFPPQRLPGATTLEEQRFCYDLTRHQSEDLGAIVELGPWMGSLTIPLAQGLADRGVTPGGFSTIHSYDRFRWDAMMAGWARDFNLPVQLEPGDSFAEAYRSQLGALSPLVEVHAADLTTEKWTGGPIEHLVNDAWKTPGVANNVVTEFFPSLIPGKSLVCHQDYLWPTESFLQIVMYQLRDYFEVVECIDESCMTNFRCIAPVPSDLIHLPDRVMDIPEDWILAASEWNRAILPEPRTPQILLGTAWLFSRIRDLERAKANSEEACRHPFAAEPLFVFQKKVLGKLEYGKDMGLDTMPWPFFSPDDWPRFAYQRNEANAVRYWDEALGWLKTTESEYPCFRQCREGFRRLEYIPGTHNPRVFIDLATGERIHC